MSQPTDAPTRLWEKKPAAGDANVALDEAVLRFTVGDDHRRDARLVAHDVRASIAHADMLRSCGWLTAEDFAALRAELERLAASHAAGEWSISRAEEDVHTALENRLVAALSDAGRRIHLGRSRNDQVLAALRLYLKSSVAELAQRVDQHVVGGLHAVAERHTDVPLPGYTHQQPAMPSTVALWAGGYATELADDADGLRAALRRVDRNPLGSAAGYGTPGLTLDREHTTRGCGFAETHAPVTAVQLSRGKAEAGVLFEITLLMQDLGRLAAELCLFTTREFGFCHLPERFTTGSSIMPQKRNPDVLELLRGRSAQAASRLTDVLGVMVKLPSGYHRDLQLIKGPLFDGIDGASDAVNIMGAMLDGLRFDAAATQASMTPELECTEAANRLVADEGIPFRVAYQRVAAEWFARTREA
ncbi:MAG: argininosuccinate lyase [Phycisphaerales bacterium]